MNPSIVLPIPVSIFQLVFQFTCVWIAYLIAKELNMSRFSNGLMLAMLTALIRRGLEASLILGYPNGFIIRYVSVVIFPIIFSVFLATGLIAILNRIKAWKIINR